MAINSDTKSLTPEELPADDQLAGASTAASSTTSTSPAHAENPEEFIRISTDDTNLAALDAEDGGAETLPDSEEYEQIMEELRHAKTEQAVSARRNRKLTLDKVTFGITGAIAVAFVVWGFVGRDSLSDTSKGA